MSLSENRELRVRQIKKNKSQILNYNVELDTIQIL